MFGRLSDKLQDVFKNLRGQGKISESNVTDALREVRLALLDADVHFQVAKDFIAKVKEKALGEAVLRSVTPGQQIVKIFHEELCALLGGNAAELNLDKPARVLIVGLNGAGKTTSSAKLARLLKSQGRSPLLIACDLHRPAAIDQLAVLGGQIDVPVFRPEKGETDVLKVAKHALDWCAATGGNVQIFDTAGRQELDEPLIEELKRQTVLMSRALNVVGLMNVQFAIQGETVFVLEVNPRASRTVPFVSKATGRPLAKIAARAMLGKTFDEQGVAGEVVPPYYSVKEAVFPFVKFPGVDTVLGPEMKSTGEVMGVAPTFVEAFVKSQIAAGTSLPDPAKGGLAFISVKNGDKPAAIAVARVLQAMGYKLIATRGTAAAIAANARCTATCTQL
jgi:energy-coupling factor transporter ATP-binding protein EcfA2